MPERIVLIPETPPLILPTWLLSDGRAGNVRQVDALARALGLAPPQRWTLQPRKPWEWAAPRALPGVAWAFGPTFTAALAQPPALAIGCGRQAALATRLLHRRGARTVQILDPRINPRYWDVIVAPEHDALHGENVIPVCGSLNPVDSSWLAAGRIATPSLQQLPRPRTAVLIGGPSAHAKIESAQLTAWMNMLIESATQQGGSLMVTTSRRTPRAATALLRKTLNGLPHQLWSGEGTNPYAGFLGWADRIVCTPDSVNMLSEACATEVPVFIFEPECVKGRTKRFLSTLLERGRAHVFDGTFWSSKAVQPLRETARIADEIERRLRIPTAS